MSCFFENTNKIDKPLVQVIKKKIETKIKLERKEKLQTITEIQTITRK